MSEKILVTDDSKCEKQRKNDDCTELKNINYKNMLFNGTILYERKDTNDIDNLENFLENEKKHNKNEHWSKLDKCEKIKKLTIFANTYKSNNKLSSEQEEKLVLFFKDMMDKKLLQRVKDVVYDKELGIIKDIPGLMFNKQNKNFTIKNTSKLHISTLKSLAPKKRNMNATLKNIGNAPLKLEEDTSSSQIYSENI